MTIIINKNFYFNNFLIYKFLVFLIFFIYLISNSYSCNTIPDSIKVYSNNNLIGTFNSGDSIFIKSNLNDNPLKFEYEFHNTETTCFSSVDDLKMKLFQEGIDFSATNYEQIQDSAYVIDKFTFEIKTSISLPNQFMSSYNILNGQSSGNFILKLDNQKPEVTFEVVSGKSVFSRNSIVDLRYSIHDSGSGLKLIQFVNCNSSTLDIEENQKNQIQTGSFKVYLKSSNKECNLIVEDLLGNIETKSINLSVDSSAPRLFKQNNYDVFKILNFQGQERTIESLKIKFQDDSFINSNNDNMKNNIYLNISSINSEMISLVNPETCISDDSQDDVIICEWKNLIINTNTISSSRMVQFQVDIEDIFGNKNSFPVSLNVEVDTQAPVINEFFVSNYKFTDKYDFNNISNSDRLIAKERALNKITTRDELYSFVYLEFEDENINGDFNIAYDFEGIQMINNIKCNLTNNKRICIYNLEDAVKNYQGLESGSQLKYKIMIRDKFGNLASKTINITFDNIKPHIINDEVKLIETEQIKDRIVRSGEEIEFKILVNDDNLVENNWFNVFADLSTISSEEGMKNKFADCSLYSPVNRTYECRFSNIIVSNGYINTSVNFTVIDTAGNIKIISKNIEILKIANEQLLSFKQNLVFKTDWPIDRNQILEADADAWFLGKIELTNIGKNSNIQILNYQIDPSSCNNSDLNPLIITDKVQIYPYEIVFNEENKKEISEIPIRVKLKTHENANDLNVKTMQCTMEVLKRDNQTLYEPEEVNFTLEFQFAEIPRGSILNQYLDDLLDDANDAEMLGKSYESYFKIYDTLNGICSGMNTLKSLMAGVEGAWTIVSLVLHNFAPTKPEAGVIDNVIGGADSTIGDLVNSLDKGIKIMCDIVTCRNGGWLGAISANVDGMDGINSPFEALNSANIMMSDALCSNTNNAVTDNSDSGAS